NCTIRYSYNVGLMNGHNSSVNTRVMNSRIYKNANYGVGAAGTMLITNNAIHDNQYAGVDGGWNGVTITDNEIYANGGGLQDLDAWAGIIMTSSARTPNSKVLIANNYIHENKGYGIYIAFGSGTTPDAVN